MYYKWNKDNLKAEFKTEGHFRAFSPSVQLAPFIHEYWFLHLNQAAKHTKSELEQAKIYPEIIFKFGVDYEEIHLHSNLKKIHSKSNISGVSNYAKASKRTNLKEDLLLIGVKFKPLGMFTLLKMPLIELYNLCIPIDELNNPAIQKIEEELYLSKNTEAAITVLESNFKKLFYQTEIDKEGEHFLNNIKTFHSTTLDVLLKDKQYGYKYLERKFKKYLGINPKKLVKLLRYLEFYKDWISKGDYKYIDLVYKHNFYDQNHLIKEFKLMLNHSPSKFLKSMDQDYTQHIIQANLHSNKI